MIATYSNCLFPIFVDGWFRENLHDTMGFLPQKTRGALEIYPSTKSANDSRFTYSHGWRNPLLGLCFAQSRFFGDMSVWPIAVTGGIMQHLRSIIHNHPGEFFWNILKAVNPPLCPCDPFESCPLSFQTSSCYSSPFPFCRLWVKQYCTLYINIITRQICTKTQSPQNNLKEEEIQPAQWFFGFCTKKHVYR